MGHDVDLRGVGAGQPRTYLPPTFFKSTNGLGLPVAPSGVIMPAAVDAAGALVDAGDAEERVRLSQ